MKCSVMMGPPAASKACRIPLQEDGGLPGGHEETPSLAAAPAAVPGQASTREASLAMQGPTEPQEGRGLPEGSLGPVPTSPHFL